MCVIKAKLLAFREEFGGYIIYVFENLSSYTYDDKYVMTVKFPNWSTPPLKIGDTGFLEFKEVMAGTSTWYNTRTGNNTYYKNDNVIFQNFVLDSQESKSTVLL